MMIAVEALTTSLGSHGVRVTGGVVQSLSYSRGKQADRRERFGRAQKPQLLHNKVDELHHAAKTMAAIEPACNGTKSQGT